MVLAEDYTYQLGDTGVLLNGGVSLPFIDVTEVAGLDSAPFRETQRDHEGQDGGFLDAEFEQGRDIIVSGSAYVDPDLCEEYFDLLKVNYAPSRVLLPFYFKQPGAEERILYVKPRGARYNITTARRIGETPVQLLMFAEDPRAYSNVLEGGDVEFGTVSTLGMGFNAGFNIGFGGGSVPSSAIFTVGGNRETPPVFTVEAGPSNVCTDPVITHLTSGNTLRFSGITLQPTETLVIDTQYRTVLLNGTSNRRGALVDPDWFFFEPGDNDIGYGAASGTNSVLHVAYRSAWR